MSNLIETSIWFYLHQNKFKGSFTGDELLKIIDVYGSLQDLRKIHSLEDLAPLSNKELDNLSKQLYKKVQSISDDHLRKYEKMIERFEQEKINIFYLSHENYPSKFRTIKNPPLTIFHKGTLKEFNQGHYVAIVGTRNSSHRAHQFARELAQELANEGYMIVSGLARGIDTEAHCGALDVHGKTVAVLPSPVDKIYPPENQELSIDISSNGALLSEISSFSYSKLQYAKYIYVERNRLTSALSDVIVIVESGEAGGSLHQFDLAKQQERRIYVPRPPDPQRSAYAGYEILIKGGAIKLHSAQDIVDFLKRKESKVKSKPNNLTDYIQKGDI